MAKTPDGWLSRIKKVRAVRDKIAAEVTRDSVASRLEPGHDLEKAQEQYPSSRDIEVDLRRAEIRKRVSLLMFEEDIRLSPEEQEEIVERQINRYYNYDVGDPSLRSHMDAPHAIRPADEVYEWCKSKKIATYETHSDDIAHAAPNWMVFKRPRLFANVNNLPPNVVSALRSEDAVYTREDNLNAVKAQRDVVQKMLGSQNVLDENGAAKDPYLMIQVHGKVDSRGSDFEIAAAPQKGRFPLDPRLAFWFQKKLEEKMRSTDLKNPKGETPSVNVVTNWGNPYSGATALPRLRYGDDVLKYKGFGENFHILQVEVGSQLRKTGHVEIGRIFAEIMREFSAEFEMQDDLSKLDAYQETYDRKKEAEQHELFSKGKIDFAPDMPADVIALTKKLRESLGVDVGGQVRVGGVLLTVAHRSPVESKENGKTMKMNLSFEGSIGESLDITPTGA